MNILPLTLSIIQYASHEITYSNEETKVSQFIGPTTRPKLQQEPKFKVDRQVNMREREYRKTFKQFTALALYISDVYEEERRRKGKIKGGKNRNP
jgi:hypothetical protein